MVPHRSTSSAILCLTSQIGRDAVLSQFYGRGYPLSFVHPYNPLSSSMHAFKQKKKILYACPLTASLVPPAPIDRQRPRSLAPPPPRAPCRKPSYHPHEATQTHRSPSIPPRAQARHRCPPRIDTRPAHPTHVRTRQLPCVFPSFPERQAPILTIFANRARSGGVFASRVSRSVRPLAPPAGRRWWCGGVVVWWVPTVVMGATG